MVPIPVSMSSNVLLNLFIEMIVFSGVSILVLLFLQSAKLGSANARARIFFALFVSPLFLIFSYIVLFNGFSLADCGLFSLCRNAIMLSVVWFGSFWRISLLKVVFLVGALLLLIILAKQILGFVLERKFVKKLDRLEQKDSRAAFQMFKAVAEKIGVQTAQLKVCQLDRPLAVATGVLHPRILISSWLIETLDADELEAVIAHEIAHIKRRDNFMNRLSMVAKDFLFFLPSTYLAWYFFIKEREKACDDMAVSITNHPLSLASALTKVCRFEAQGGLIGRVINPVSHGFSRRDTALEERIKRLAYHSGSVHGQNISNSLFSLAVGFLILGMILAPALSLQDLGKAKSSKHCCSSPTSAECSRNDCSPK